MASRPTSASESSKIGITAGDLLRADEPIDEGVVIDALVLRAAVNTPDGPREETVTVREVWQLTGDYGDTRRVGDLSAEDLAPVFNTWTDNLKRGEPSIIDALPDVDVPPIL